VQELRWKQRFENLQKAKATLKLALDRLQETPDDKLMQLALIQSFEFTYELSWKTMKDYLKHEGVLEAVTPRQVIKQAFHYKIIPDGQTWIDMLENRNLLSHVYSEEFAQKAVAKIISQYANIINELCEFLTEKL
jgi:nucleotidyltransferase substrate binding protein (TIGR01987 family)